MRSVATVLCLLVTLVTRSQDTTIIIDNKKFTLPEVVVNNNADYKKILNQIKEDTSFYKSFKNLRVLGYTSYNDVNMFNKSGQICAGLFSKTKQTRTNGCRSMQILEEQVKGDYYSNEHECNYMTGQLYAALFFTKGTVCGESNIVAGTKINPNQSHGIDKHKDQLKMLFFNPGKKIQGIPFIGNKLDLYDDKAHELYDYKLDISEYQGSFAYVFSILPKREVGSKSDEIVVDKMITWFDMKTMEVLARNYNLSYNAGIYDFDVQMEVEMTKFEGLIVPKTLRYKGNWSVLFKKRERGSFTATLFDFVKEK